MVSYWATLLVKVIFARNFGHDERQVKRIILHKVIFVPHQVRLNTEKLGKLDKFGKLEFRNVCINRWQIQDFPEVGSPTPKVKVKSYYLANFFPKTA